MMTKSRKDHRVRQPVAPSSSTIAAAFALCLSILFLPLLGGCSDRPATSRTLSPSATSGTMATSGTNSQTSAASTGSGLTDPSSSPSGPLRLSCTPRATLNPLADLSASYQQVTRLVYEGLYRIDSSGAAVPLLAGSAAVSQDGMSVDISLVPGRVFHNGKPVTAQDAVASYNALRLAGANSAYAARLPDIAGITALDAATIRVVLARPQPDYAWQLTFPVIPAAGLTESAAKPMTILPGSGPYMISAYQAGTGLTLSVSERQPDWEKRTVRRILVREYKDSHDAMKAFEKDEIDLIGLSPEEYPVYAIRNGLRLDRFWSDQFVFVAYNNRPGTLLENTGRLAFVKALCQDERLIADSDALGLYPAAVPVFPDSLVWTGIPTEQPDRAWLYRSTAQQPLDPRLAYGTTRRALVILAPDNDPLRSELAKRVSALLAGHKILSEVRILPSDAYFAARLAGQYDILMAQAVVPGSMDPRWLIGPSADGSVPGSELLSRTGLAGYPDVMAAIDSLYREGTAKLAGKAELAGLLRQACEKGPFTGIGFRYAALGSGHRVRGQARPQARNLFEGIEDLWIWST